MNRRLTISCKLSSSLFSSLSFHQKTSRSCDRSRKSCRNFLKIFEKALRTRGHCALGSPRPGSVFVMVQRRCLLNHKHCHKEKGTRSNIRFELGDM
jgi:hypothetical protein